MNEIQLAPYAADYARLPRMTQLIRENGLRTFLLHLRAFEEMAEHQVKGPITVHCLQGSVLFTAGDDSAELKPGTLLSVPGGLKHALMARLGSLLLITMCEPS